MRIATVRSPHRLDGADGFSKPRPLDLVVPAADRKQKLFNAPEWIPTRIEASMHLCGGAVRNRAKEADMLRRAVPYLLMSQIVGAGVYPHVVDKYVDGLGSIQIAPDWPRYADGEKVVLKAIPAAGQRFAGWVTNPVFSVPTDSFQLNSSIQVTAVFVDTLERVQNGGFLFGWQAWTRWAEPILSPVYSIRSGAACIDPRGKGGNSAYLQFFTSLARLDSGSSYRLTFRTSASRTRVFNLAVRDNQKPWTNRYFAGGVQSTTTSARHVYTFRLTSGPVNPRLSFDLGADSGEICFDSISLRRDPAYGIAPRRILDSNDPSVLALGDGAIALDVSDGSRWEFRDLEGRLVRAGEFAHGGSNMISGLPRIPGYVVVRDRAGKRHSQRVVVF